MPIILRLDRVMADRKMSLKELSERVGVANVNLSKLKTGKVSAIRFSWRRFVRCWTASPGISWNTSAKKTEMYRPGFLRSRGGFGSFVGPAPERCVAFLGQACYTPA